MATSPSTPTGAEFPPPPQTLPCSPPGRAEPIPCLPNTDGGHREHHLALRDKLSTINVRTGIVGHRRSQQQASVPHSTLLCKAQPSQHPRSPERGRSPETGRSRTVLSPVSVHWSCR